MPNYFSSYFFFYNANINPEDVVPVNSSRIAAPPIVIASPGFTLMLKPEEESPREDTPIENQLFKLMP